MGRCTSDSLRLFVPTLARWRHTVPASEGFVVGTGEVGSDDLRCLPQLRELRIFLFLLQPNDACSALCREIRDLRGRLDRRETLVTQDDL